MAIDLKSHNVLKRIRAVLYDRRLTANYKLLTLSVFK